MNSEELVVKLLVGVIIIWCVMGIGAVAYKAYMIWTGKW